MKKAVGVVLGLLPVSVSAECVPVPDCASIGYTETSCDGDNLKCPFNSSKLKCFPCDSSFRYTCTGDNIENPIGDACNNKYTACECVAGATFSNGECICDTSCNTIGNIYYSDGTCSSCNLTDKTPVGIIAYKDDFKNYIIGLNQTTMSWSITQTDDEGNQTITYNKDIENLANYKDSASALQDTNGFKNTQAIIETYGINATGIAAIYCYNYKPTGMEHTQGQWHLPTLNELYHIRINNIAKINTSYTTLGIKNSSNGIYWSSIENSTTQAWTLRYDGYYSTRTKTNINTVTCLLAI